MFDWTHKLNFEDGSFGKMMASAEGWSSWRKHTIFLSIKYCDWVLELFSPRRLVVVINCKMLIP